MRHSASPNVLAAVGAAVVGHQQRRHGMPTVAREHAGRAVVAGDDEHVGLQGHDPRHAGVELFGAFHLGVEVAVLAGAVGVLEVDEEEVVLRPVLFEHVHLLVERLGVADDVHADESGEALVHRIDGDRRGLEAVDFFVAGQDWAWPRNRGACSSWPWAGRRGASSPAS